MINTRYSPSTLVWRKDKWYVQVTKPKELQFGNDKQARRSTGTSDKQEARFLQHRLAQEIYEGFDKALMKTDPVFEALRPIFETEDCDCNPRQWYTEGQLEVILRGEKTTMSKVFGVARFQLGAPMSLVALPLEKWLLKDHFDLLRLVSHLGHAIPAHILDLLSSEAREKVMQMAAPKPLSPEDTVDVVQKLPSVVAKNALRFSQNEGMIKLTGEATKTKSPTLAVVLADYLMSRPEKSRKGDKIQLNKWLSHEKFRHVALIDVSPYDAYDFLYEYGETLTKSSIGVLRAALSNVFKWAKTQRTLGITHNPFRDLNLTNVGQDGTDREPFTRSQLDTLFQQHMTADDRAALLILLTTGMRGGELMQMVEAHEEDGIRYLDLRKASVKTISSKRIVPLHDKLATTSFPLKTTQGKLNRLIGATFGDEPVSLHSLRHNFKDLARDAGISQEINNFITGHKTGGVAGSYGVGPSLKVRHEAIMKLDVPWLDAP